MVISKSTMMFSTLAAAGLSACMQAGPTKNVAQSGFQPVTTRAEFVQVVEGRRFVDADGWWVMTDAGRMYGQFGGKKLEGTWRWDQGAWCRKYVFGDKIRNESCQAIFVDGNRVKFVKDRGKGESSIETLQ